MAAAEVEAGAMVAATEAAAMVAAAEAAAHLGSHLGKCQRICSGHRTCQH